MEYRSVVIKVAGFGTITPILQYSNTLKLIKNHNSMDV
jgi:hypothetical protein